MTSRSNRSFPKLTAAALIALTCALAGCGRKAGLDAPPGAVVDQSSTSDFATSNPNSATNLQSEVYRPPGSTGAPLAPRGEKKRIPLDAILD
ncbi:MAG: lipoprotein [Afipia sp.]|nr:lipoprotein [Afipia sp.]